MKSYLITALIFCNSNTVSFAQTVSCACCSINHKEFNFWIGEWEVFNQKGEKVGDNTIVVLQEGCVLQENWRTPKQTGTSYNYYNPLDSTWNQLYIDNAGTILELKGKYSDGKMVLYSAPVKSKQGDFFYRNRITWQPIDSRSVRQKWDIVSTGGEIVYVAFDGIYKKSYKHK